MATGELPSFLLALAILVLGPAEGAFPARGIGAVAAALLLPGLAFASRRFLAGGPVPRAVRWPRGFAVAVALDLGAYAAAVHALGLRAVVAEAASALFAGAPSPFAAIAPTLADLVSLLPFVAARAAAHVGTFPVIRRLRPGLALGRVVSDPLRLHAAFLAALLLVDGTGAALGALPAARIATYRHPGVEGLAAAAVILFALALVPIGVRLVLPGASLPPGPERDAIAATLAERRVRVRDIWCWDTGGRDIPTAAIAGFLGATRIFVVTDALLATVGPADLPAVAGHEAGHVTGGHLLLYAGLALGLVLPLAAVGVWLEAVAGPSPPLTLDLGIMGVVAGGWLLFFGFLSRRLEIEADLEGARAAGGMERYTAILHAIAFRGEAPEEPAPGPFRQGIREGECPARGFPPLPEGEGSRKMRRPWWRRFGAFRHFEPRLRLQMLEALRDPAAREAAERRIGWLKRAAWVYVAAAVGLYGAGLIRDAWAPAAEREVRALGRAFGAGDEEAFETLYESARTLDPGPRPLLLGAEGALAAGRAATARERLDEARRRAAADAAWDGEIARVAAEIAEATAPQGE